MAITAGGSAKTTLSADGNSAYTQSYNIGTLTNGLLVVLVTQRQTTGITIVSVTWNGVSMAEAVSRYRTATGAGVGHGVGIFYLVNPDNGTHNLTTTFSGALGGSDQYGIHPTWWNGASQTQATVKDQHNSDAITSGVPSLAITPANNDELIVDIYLTESNGVLTAAGSPATATNLQNTDFGTSCVGCSYVIQTTAGAQTMAYTGSSDECTCCTASFNAFGVGGGGGSVGVVGSGLVDGNRLVGGRLIA